MKKLFIFAMCAIALASCNEGAKKAEAQARAERDSLNQVIAQKDDEINDMMTTLIDIEEGFREITEAQNRVTLAKSGEGTNTKQRIAENFQFIQSMMQQNKDLINKLKQQVRESSIKGDKLKKIIANLTEQMETKDKQITELVEQLELKNIHIGELKYAINSLKEDAQSLQDENEAQSKTINARERGSVEDHQCAGQAAQHRLVCFWHQGRAEEAAHSGERQGAAGQLQQGVLHQD